VLKLKEKLKALTKRNRGIGLVDTIHELNPVLRGFANYFRRRLCAHIETGDGLAGATFTLPTAQTVVEAEPAASPTGTVGLSSAVQVDQGEQLAQCGVSTGSPVDPQRLSA
jgi:hypothetical protein